MQKDYLVGSTGFVGSNLVAAHEFTGLFHSSNVTEAYGGRPDLLVYAGVPAEMFLANQNPERDEEIIQRTIYNIQEIAPRKIVLISTSAVYPVTKQVNEDTPIDAKLLSAYGANRYTLENWVREHISESLIIRLPALFGVNLKKNFLYDFIHIIPALLKKEKYSQLIEKEPILSIYYQDRGDGFYACRKLSDRDIVLLKECFERLNFSALNFTDSRSNYQFYNLERLWDHIVFALAHNLPQLNIATPPVNVGELYQMLTGCPFENILQGKPFDYDIKSRYAALFGQADGYIMDRETELADIRAFLRSQGAAVI